MCSFHFFSAEFDNKLLTYPVIVVVDDVVGYNSVIIVKGEQILRIRVIFIKKNEKINNRLLCEMMSHPDFIKLMTDLQIYADGYADMMIQTANATLEVPIRRMLSRQLMLIWLIS